MTNELKKYTRLQKLLDHTSAVIGLRICYHDRIGNSGLPLRYLRHWHPACSNARIGKKPVRCVDFDAVEVHRDLKDNPEGRIHVCPYGLTEIAVPVFVNNEFAGVLFAGPCWTHKKPCPYPELTRPKNRRWLEECRTILQAVAYRFASLLQINENLIFPNPSRKTKIINFLRKHQDKTVTLSQLAKELSLSPSRASHIVNDLFQMSLPNLINEMKLKQATYYLSATELSIAEIADRFGYHDQNYFTRLFTKQYGITPTAYRLDYPFEV